MQELQKDVNAVIVKDEEIEKAILMLVEQIGKIRNIEQQAWTDFKNIARVLDDRKARELFYKVDGAWRNIKELQQYISEKFAGSFDELIAKVEEQIRKVDQEVGVIKESGVDLKKRLLSMQAPKAAMEEEEEEEAPKGMLTRFIIDPIKSVFSTGWAIVSWPYYKLFGPKAVSEDEEDEQEQPAEKPVAKKEAEEEPKAEPEEAAEPAEEVTVEETITEEEPAEFSEGATEDSEAKSESEPKVDEEPADSGKEPEKAPGEERTEEFQEFDFELPDGLEETEEIDLGDLSQFGE